MATINLTDVLNGEDRPTIEDIASNTTNNILIDKYTGAVGNISNPILDIPLNNNLNIKQGNGSVTFSRASTATYTDMYGVLKTAQVDEPRFETGGLLVEPSSTNLALYSNDFSNSSWVKSNATLSIIDNDSPGIVSTSTKLEATSDGYCRIYQGMQNPEGDITLSFLVKRGSVDTCSLRIIGSTEDVINFTLTDKWERITLSTTQNAPGSFHIFCNHDGLQGTASAGDFIYISLAQTENMPNATSIIPTTDTTMTRARDIPMVDFYGNHPKIETGTELSISVSYSVLDKKVSPSNRIILAPSNYAPPFSLLRIDINIDVPSYFRSGRAVRASTPISETTQKVCCTVSKDNTVKVYHNGVLESTLTSIPDGTISDYVLKKIGIGCSDSGYNQLNGHIKDLRIYDKELTESEVGLL